jgi:hypothetical protein
MLIRFVRTELVETTPARLFAVLTDYANYPRANPQVLKVVVKRHDAHGAEVYAERNTPIGKKVTFIDTYALPPPLHITRRYVGQDSASSTWTVEPAFGGRCYFTIMAEMRVPFVPGIFLRPILRRMFYRLTFPPFIHAATRAATQGTTPLSAPAA